METRPDDPLTVTLDGLNSVSIVTTVPVAELVLAIVRGAPTLI